MNLLTTSEKVRAASDVAELIVCSGFIAKLLRRTDATPDRYGEEESEYEDTGITFPFEWVPKPKESVNGDTPDAEIAVLPDLEIKEEDRIEYNNVKYKVLNDVEKDLFGVITHKVVRLARVY